MPILNQDLAEVKQLPPDQQPDQKSSQMAPTADYTGFSVDDQTKNDVTTDVLVS